MRNHQHEQTVSFQRSLCNAPVGDGRSHRALGCHAGGALVHNHTICGLVWECGCWKSKTASTAFQFPHTCPHSPHPHCCHTNNASNLPPTKQTTPSQTPPTTVCFQVGCNLLKNLLLGVDLCLWLPVKASKGDTFPIGYPLWYAHWVHCIMCLIACTQHLHVLKGGGAR